MRRFLLIIISLLFLDISVFAQIQVTSHHEGWDETPPEALLDGYNLQKSVLVQMDEDSQMEQVLLFGHDNGHWPEFDLFKFYVAVVGNYDKKVKFISEEMVTDHYNMLVEDRDCNGLFEIYVSYIKEGSFKVDTRGYNMEAIWCQDRIELKKEKQL